MQRVTGTSRGTSGSRPNVVAYSLQPMHVRCCVCCAQLVQWKLPSLRCMGSEQLSLFACRSAFNSVTISMRMLRRCRESGQLLLLYRHCSRALASIILHKLYQPEWVASSATSAALTDHKKTQQKAWAQALAAGVCSLDPQQQQQQQKIPRSHSTCLLGTGAACIMDMSKTPWHPSGHYATHIPQAT